MGLLTHYRFILLPASAFFYLILTSRGRIHLREKGPWLTGILLLLGLVPALINNLRTGFVPVHYYIAERHGLSFSFKKLLDFILEQFFTSTPFFLIALVGVLILLMQRARKDDDRAALFSIISFTHLSVFLVASPFEASELTTMHWTIPGYVILLPYLPEALRGFVNARPTIFRKITAGLVPGLGGFAVLLIMIELGTGVLKIDEIRMPYIGWSKVAEKTSRDFLPGMLKESKERPLIVADNYVLGANLEFYLHELADIYVFDHEKNRMHGRSYQYRIWDRDEEGLRSNTCRNVLLIMETTATGVYENWELQRHFCSLFESANYVDEQKILNGKKRFIFLSGNKLITENSDTDIRVKKKTCQLGIISCLEETLQGSRVSGLVTVYGWAVQDDNGIDGVEIIIDHKETYAARYGISRMDVNKTYPDSTDLNQPNVGFLFYWDTRKVKPGKHLMVVRITPKEGKQVTIHDREFMVEAISK